MSDIRETMNDLYIFDDDEGLLFLTEKEYDEAIVGVTETFDKPTSVVYDANKIIDILIKQGLDVDDALEHFNFNIAGSYVGEKTPVFVWTDFKNFL